MVTEMKTLYPSHRFSKHSSSPVLVRADKFKLIQVLINYLTNAVNFSPASSQITVNSIRKHSYVEVSIRDQGIGIPDGQHQKIFHKFYRSGQKEVRERSSKGLGLYLVREIIQQHGGTVRVEKGEEKGSVFYFTLPLASSPGNLSIEHSSD
jgi:two-component system CheB/CheR fusion protein